MQKNEQLTTIAATITATQFSSENVNKQRMTLIASLEIMYVTGK